MMYNFRGSGKERSDSDGSLKERVKRRKDGLTDGERGRKGKVSGRYEKQSRHQEED